MARASVRIKYQADINSYLAKSDFYDVRDLFKSGLKIKA